MESTHAHLVTSNDSIQAYFHMRKLSQTAMSGVAIDTKIVDGCNIKLKLDKVEKRSGKDEHIVKEGKM